MVVGKEDLGLSLSLSCSNPTNTTSTTSNNNKNTINTSNNHNNNHNNMGFFMMMNNKNNHHNNHQQTTPSSNNSVSTPLQLNLMMTSPSLPSSISHTLPWYRPVRPSGGGGGGVSGEEEAGVSSPYSTVSTASGKRSSSERDSASAGVGDEIELERDSSRGVSDDEDGGENSRKKLRLNKDQSAVLEESFKEHSTLNPKQKQALAKRLGLRERQVEVWFQNRRARTKLKQTEVDCEYLKGCCEKLTEENRRLQKEVHELRTLKLSPQFYMHMTPPTTLTMCPSCQRVATPQAQAQPAYDTKPNLRPMPVNLWGGAPVPVSVRPLPFDVFRPRS